MTVPDGQGGSYGELYRVDRTCRAVRLDRVVSSYAHASATLADDAYVLFATDGRLRQLDLEGRLVREITLASPVRVRASPVIHGGKVYVLQEDGTLNFIEDLGVSGYGTAVWPRYRHDNAGSGALGGPTPDPPSGVPTSSRTGLILLLVGLALGMVLLRRRLPGGGAAG